MLLDGRADKDTHSPCLADGAIVEKGQLEGRSRTPLPREAIFWTAL